MTLKEIVRFRSTKTLYRDINYTTEESKSGNFDCHSSEFLRA